MINVFQMNRFWQNVDFDRYDKIEHTILIMASNQFDKRSTLEVVTFFWWLRPEQAWRGCRQLTRQLCRAPG